MKPCQHPVSCNYRENFGKWQGLTLILYFNTNKALRELLLTLLIHNLILNGYKPNQSSHNNHSFDL